MDIFWDAILSIGSDASDASDASYMLQQNSRGGYRGIGGRDIQHNGVNASLASLTSPGADPYDTEERLAIQQEESYISDLAEIPGFEGLPDLTPAQHGEIQRRLMGYGPIPPESGGSVHIPVHFSGECALLPPGSTRHGIGRCAITKSERAPKGGTGYAHAYETAPRVCNRFSAATQQPVRQSAPAAITCSSCAEFHPGKTPNGVGRCSRTADGSPPVASRGYGACFPTAPRFCSDHKEL